VPETQPAFGPELPVSGAGLLRIVTLWVPTTSWCLPSTTSTAESTHIRGRCHPF